MSRTSRKQVRARMKRIFCFLFHWRRHLRDAATRFYRWRCQICGERWTVER